MSRLRDEIAMCHWQKFPLPTRSNGLFCITGPLAKADADADHTRGRASFFTIGVRDRAA